MFFPTAKTLILLLTSFFIALLEYLNSFNEAPRINVDLATI
tara:strand:- start:320 stop:442 length:123 start_codon:yes stop_codon:yes gene_type:complete